MHTALLNLLLKFGELEEYTPLPILLLHRNILFSLKFLSSEYVFHRVQHRLVYLSRFKNHVKSIIKTFIVYFRRKYGFMISTKVRFFVIEKKCHAIFKV